MENVVLIIHLLLALALILTVLLQRSEGGGLGIGGGGGGTMAGRPKASPMAKFTWIIAIGFIITSLTLTYYATRDSAGASVIDRVGTQTEGGQQPADPALPPALQGDLTPPSPSDGPVVPPSE
jgi:preprotein translocase subunit SecG